MLVASVTTASEIGQALLGILVAVVGYVLHHKARKIEVLVNGRMSDAIARIDQLEKRLLAEGVTLPPHPPSVVVDPPNV